MNRIMIIGSVAGALLAAPTFEMASSLL